MSTAGNICGACQHPIRDGTLTAGCPHCGALFHQSCWENALLLCPVCQQACAPSAPEEAIAFTQFSTRDFQRSRTSFTYHATLLTLGGAMLLLFAAYVALIVGVGSLVIFYAFQFHFEHNYLLGSLVYLAGVMVGTLVLLFLLKPFYSHKAARPEKISLQHSDAPQLFALIGRICRSLDAPIPSRVDINCSINASVEFRTGLRSLWGNDMVLTIGLPLVAGLNLSQFAGVLAHEYGHFSQGTAMRTNYLIRKINDWFARIVYERDALDEMLAQQADSEKERWTWRVLAFAALGGIWLIRRLLWVFVAVGNLVSSSLSRQMEFDADRYEARMSGSDNFVNTFLRLQHLNLGLAAANKKLVAQWKREKTLFDQIPDFIVTQTNEISAEAQERYYSRALQQKTHWFDTHPADGARIARARSLAEPGLLRETVPAIALFVDYPALSRRATESYYRELIGNRYQPELLIAWQARGADAASDCVIERHELAEFFLGIDLSDRPIFPVENKMFSLMPIAELHDHIALLRAQMAAALADTQNTFSEWQRANREILAARQTLLCLEAGYSIDPAEFGLEGDEIDPILATARAERERSQLALAKYEALGCARLSALTQWIHLPQVASEITNARALQDEAKGALWMLAQLKNVFPSLIELREDCRILEILLRERNLQPLADNAMNVFDAMATQIQDRLNYIQDQVGRLRHPYQPNFESLLLGEYARNKEYHPDPLELLLREGQSHSRKLLALHTQLLGRLAAICTRVEQLTIVA